MRVIEPGSGVTRKAPVEGGPSVEVLVGAGGVAEGENLGAARVLIPPSGGMPEHEHGESEAMVVPQSGRVVIDGGGESQTLEPGAMALIGVGERVSLTNPSASEPASLLVFFAPPGFVKTLASWPAAGESA